MKRFVLPAAAFLLLSLGTSWQTISGPKPAKLPPEFAVDVETKASAGSETGKPIGHEAPAPEWTRDPRAVVTVEAAGRGNPWVHFLDGREVPTEFSAQEVQAQAIRSRSARPKALASADFDEDGVPDLLAAYEEGTGRTGGLMVLHRGNVDAIYPNAPGAKERKAKGKFTDAPFLPDTKVVSLPAKPKFVGAGDFDADGHWDAVTAAEGESALYWLPGDGKGGFGQARKIVLPGQATAFVTGDVNRRDGLTDVVVGVTGPSGPQLLVFEGPEGALAWEPEVFLLSSPATAIALDYLDDEYPVDLAVAAGSELLVIHGRDRKLSLDEGQRAKVKPATVDRVVFPFAVAALATGNFDTDRARDVALLSENGDLYQAPVLAFLTDIRDGITPMKALGEPHLQGTDAKEILRIKSSSFPGDDLLLLDRKNQSLDLVMPLSGWTETGTPKPDLRAEHMTGRSVALDTPARLHATLKAQGTPVAVLPMRLSPDAFDDFVILSDAPASLAVAPTGPTLPYVVNSTGDPGDGTCDATCTLREAINTSNANPGADTINFNIPGAGPHVIQPDSRLPIITESVRIDGSSQPGFPGTPIVVLDGSSVSTIDPSPYGLEAIAGVTHITDLSIINFRSTISGAGTGIVCGSPVSTICVIEGNYIGIDPTSMLTGPNCDGVTLASGASSSRVGSTFPTARNVITGNTGAAIIAADDVSDLVIQGNYLGVDPESPGPVGNGGYGIFVSSDNQVIGGTVAGARNMISWNELDGISIIGGSLGGTLVQGNFIGTSEFGGDSGNQRNGVFLDGIGNCTIGGTSPAARNVISGNTSSGIEIRSFGNFVQGNYIGLEPDGNTPLPNALEPPDAGVSIWTGSNNQIGGVTPAARNIISGNYETGVDITGGELNTIAGNFIGTDASGTLARPNAGAGVYLGLARYNSIGVASGGNVISGNLSSGVWMFDSDANWISNNLIGLAADGTSPLGNAWGGVIVGGAGTLIGGISAEYQNTIAFNSGGGIRDLGGFPLSSTAILVNSIFDNEGLGIDLSPVGVNLNDPGDWDVVQNHPVLTLAESTGGSLLVEGTLDSHADSSFTINVYFSPSCDPSGYGEGKVHLSKFTVSTDSSGLATFSETITGVAIFGGAITATASNLGNTSEFSACASPVGVPPLPVTGVMLDDGPPPLPESVSWDPAPGATSYHVYVGTGLTMPGLSSQAADSCEVGVLPTNGFDIPPAGNPPPGQLLWILLTAEGQYGEGTVQPGSDGPRILTSTGQCGASCAHDRCVAGGPLVPACDLCASILCDSDPSCCDAVNGSWSAACVQKVRTICRNLSCPESQGQCQHGLCDSGGQPLSPGCDAPPLPVSCTAAICQADPHCCQQTWDDACVAKVASVCGYNCL